MEVLDILEVLYKVVRVIDIAITATIYVLIQPWKLRDKMSLNLRERPKR